MTAEFECVKKKKRNCAAEKRNYSIMRLNLIFVYEFKSRTNNYFNITLLTDSNQGYLKKKI